MYCVLLKLLPCNARFRSSLNLNVRYLTLFIEVLLYNNQGSSVFISSQKHAIQGFGVLVQANFSMKYFVILDV